MARSVGALSVCDGAQGAPHLRVGFDALDEGRVLPLGAEVIHAVSSSAGALPSTGPRSSVKVCAAAYPANDSTACAYDYGWNAAKDSYARAATAASSAAGSHRSRSSRAASPCTPRPASPG